MKDASLEGVDSSLRASSSLHSRMEEVERSGQNLQHGLEVIIAVIYSRSPTV